MRNILRIALVLIAIVALFGGDLFGEYAAYSKVVGLCAMMFLTFMVSKKVTTKKPDSSKNVKF